MFVKILTATKQFKTVGEVVEITDDAQAKTLIDNGIAEATEAPAAVKSLESEMKTLVSAAATAAASEAVAQITKTLGTVAPKRLNHNDDPNADVFVLPSEAKRYGSLRNFKNTEEGRVEAYRFGMWCLSNYARNCRNPEKYDEMQSYVGKAKRLGISMKMARAEEGDNTITVTKNVNGEIVNTKASSENVNSSSGYLVPDEFQNTLVDLREKFGVFRQNAKIVPMASDSRTDPRRRGGVSAVFVSEDQAGTQSTKTWDRVRLSAKKLMFLSKYSNELNEDAVLNIADDLAGEAAYAFANKEDNCGFRGLAKGPDGGITGVCQALLNVDSTIGNILGITVGAAGTGAAYSGFTLANFNSVVGSLPEFADANAKWYVSKFFWGSVMQKLATAGGGNRVMDLVGGAREKSFLGYPVIISQVMPKTAAVNDVVCLLGDLQMAASLGDRRQFTIALSDAALNAFEQDEVAMRATERFDIVVHDVGESSANAARDPVMGLTAGPIVGLATASS